MRDRLRSHIGLILSVLIGAYYAMPKSDIIHACSLMTPLLVKLIYYACMHVMGNRLRINHVQQVRNNSCRLMPLLVSLNIMHACMYACMYVCMHVCMYVCMYVCMHGCMHGCMCVCVCMCVCMHVWMYVC